MALEPPSSDIGGVLDKDDILDILNDETISPDGEKDKSEEDVKKEKPDESEEEDRENEEDKGAEKKDTSEDEEEPEDERVLQLDTEIEFPTKKAVLKEFPTLFKKFPTIEAAIYRDRQFTEVFPTPEDASEAAAKAKQLDVFSDELYSGTTENMLKTVRENDPDAFYRIADNFLENVNRVDQKAYHHIIGNVVKYTIMAMADEAKLNNDEELMNQAQALNKFVFRTDKFVPPQRLVQPVDTKSTVEQERMELVKERFESANSGLQEKVDNQILATINTYIDPNSSMTPFEKKHAVNEAFTKLESHLANDRTLRSTLDRLWKASAEEKFSSSSLDNIRRAYLSKAKTYLTDAIKSARNEALKGKGRNASSTGERRRGHLPVGRSSGTGTGSGKKGVPTGMSNKDFIMSD